jgi:hypothetical protein
MLHRRLACPLLAVALLIATDLLARAEPRALLELFTSQGCSSCPAADKLLGEFAGDSSLVAVSVPIDYWDYLGWKDTLASPAHSARQRAYARVRGDRQVYTPQVVINGAVHALGSDRAAIERAIAQTRHNNPAIMSLPVSLTLNGSQLSVNVQAAKDEKTVGEVWLCPVSKAITVKIGRGENHGHTITYHNVVRHWIKLGDWTGKITSWDVPITDLKSEDVDSAVVMVQSGTHDKPGVILGTALATLH